MGKKITTQHALPTEDDQGRAISLNGAASLSHFQIYIFRDLYLYSFTLVFKSFACPFPLKTFTYFLTVPRGHVQQFLWLLIL